jgi:hypothetical protein
MRLAALVLGISVFAGCVSPPSGGERLISEANQVVTAARFGRMDLVLACVKPELRTGFAASHAEWGSKIRILDMEYGGATPIDEKKAVVAVNVAWSRLDETIVRSTALRQTWEFGEERWQIIGEEVADGDPKLLSNGIAPPRDESEIATSASLPP